MTPIEQIIADFEFLDEWEDRYRYIIELGKGLTPLPPEEHSEANKVRGCASQVWLWTRKEPIGDRQVMHFVGDSDALIVKGLVAIALALFDRKTPEEVRSLDAEAVFDKLDLREHLSTQRANGLRALVDRIKAEAAAALTSAT